MIVGTHSVRSSFSSRRYKEKIGRQLHKFLSCGVLFLTFFFFLPAKMLSSCFVAFCSAPTTCWGSPDLPAGGYLHSSCINLIKQPSGEMTSFKTHPDGLDGEAKQNPFWNVSFDILTACTASTCIVPRLMYCPSISDGKQWFAVIFILQWKLQLPCWCTKHL